MSLMWGYSAEKCEGSLCIGDCDGCPKADKTVVYRYGMRLRGFSIGCQPKEGFLDREDDESGRYYDILVYDRELSNQEVEDYELDYIGREIE